MKPESRCGGSLVVAVFLEVCVKQIVGELASLGKAIDNFENLEIDPSIAGFVGEVIFLEKSSGTSERRTRAYSLRSRGVFR